MKAPEIGSAVLAFVSQALVTTAITVFLIISGYAARQGVQSLVMLTIATAALATRQNSADAKWLARGAAALIALAALALAFVVPKGAPYAFALTLAVGAGTWLAVGATLLARGRPGENPFRRRPEAWPWLVGGLAWAAISITYANRELVLAAGRLAAYLWTPWSIVVLLVSGLLLPRLIARKWPAMVPASGRWARSSARGIALGLAVSLLVGYVVANVASPFAPDIIVSDPCPACPASTYVAALEAHATDDGRVVAVKFGAAPSGVLLHLAGLQAPLELRATPEGWAVRGNGYDVDTGSLSVTSFNETVLILLQDQQLIRPLAVEGIGGNRLPARDYYSPATDVSV